MARAWHCGHESGATSEWELIDTGATVVSTTVRTGAYSGKISGLVSGARSGFFQAYATGTSAGPWYFRTYINIETLPSAANTIQSLISGAATSNTKRVNVKLNSDGTLTLFNLTTQIGSASSALSTGTWYRLELLYDGSGGTSNVTIRAYLDGVEFAGATGLTVSSHSQAVMWGGNLQVEAQTQGVWYFDDHAINDSTGAVQNTLPGAGSIIHLHPDSAGDFAEGSASGSAPAATGWDSVDEVPPNDGTDYWVLATDSGSSTSADRLDVNCESFAPSVTSITLVSVGVRSRGATSTADSYAARIKSQASGTIVESATVGIATASFVTNDDTAGSKNYKLTQYVDPQAGGAWTTALLNTMQIGIRAPDANPDVWVTSLWALVEYVPSVGGGGGSLVGPLVGPGALAGNGGPLMGGRLVR